MDAKVWLPSSTSTPSNPLQEWIDSYEISFTALGTTMWQDGPRSGNRRQLAEQAVGERAVAEVARGAETDASRGASAGIG